MPNKNTFKIPPIKKFVEMEINQIPEGGVIVDPFANSCTYGTITNDLNPQFKTTYHLDALEFLKMLESNSADLVLYDPPYSLRQASECYKGFGKEKLKINVTNQKYWKQCRDEIARIVKPKGIVLSFGWNSNGMGKKRGFQMTDILMVAHGGAKNDTLCCREVKLELFY